MFGRPGLGRILLFLVLVGGASAGARAEVGIGFGVSCTDLIQQIIRTWIDVRQVMAPMTVKLKRARREHFICIDPRWTEYTIERPTGTLRTLKCFMDPENEGLDFCCDPQLEACVQLKRELIPEEERAKRRKQKEPEVHQSQWVRPPTEDDQWQTIEQ